MAIGEPIPATYIYSDNPAGNNGLCQFQAAMAKLPQEPVTPQQIAGQNTAIDAYQDDPNSTVFHALSNITNPTLVVAGTLDEVLSVEDSLLIVNNIPGASLLQFADAGHAAILQYGISSGLLISAFLDE